MKRTAKSIALLALTGAIALTGCTADPPGLQDAAPAQGAPEPDGDPEPLPTEAPTGQDDAGQGDAAPDGGDNAGQDDAAPDGGDAAAPGGGTGDLTTTQELRDYYIAARDDGSIYDHLPDSEESREYTQAFLFLLTDLSTAESFSSGEAIYLDDARELEQRFLNVEDLGSSVTITNAEGETFEHDGSPPN